MMYIYLGQMGKRICLSLVLILVKFTNNIVKRVMPYLPHF